MRTIAMIAVCAIAFGAPGAAAQDNTQKDITLSAWLAGCQSNRQSCLEDLTYGLEAAYEDMGEICPPDGLTEDAAAEQELRWLENAAAYNSGMAAGSELDAEWTALHTLWPCNN